MLTILNGGLATIAKFKPSMNERNMSWVIPTDSRAGLYPRANADSGLALTLIRGIHKGKMDGMSSGRYGGASSLGGAGIYVWIRTLASCVSWNPVDFAVADGVRETDELEDSL